MVEDGEGREAAGSVVLFSGGIERALCDFTLQFMQLYNIAELECSSNYRCVEHHIFEFGSNRVVSYAFKGYGYHC